MTMRGHISILFVTLVVALAGLTGAANASATVDLIWIEACDTPQGLPPPCLLPTQRICPVDSRAVGVPGYSDGVALDSDAYAVWPCENDEITLVVILTAGPTGSWGAGVSVNYSDALPQVSVLEFQSLPNAFPSFYLPLSHGTTTDQPPYINNITALADPPAGFGLGLPPGATAWLGTVMFHKDLVALGTYKISVGTNGPGGTDAVFDGFGNDITQKTTFNSAFLLPEPSAPAALGSGVALLASLYRRRRRSLKR